MPKAGKKYMGRGAQGKHAGTGAMTEMTDLDVEIGENAILSNRDKTQHSKQRGQDSKFVQVEQMQDSVDNRGGE
jgi:hypothetical protein